MADDPKAATQLHDVTSRPGRRPRRHGTLNSYQNDNPQLDHGFQQDHLPRQSPDHTSQVRQEALANHLREYQDHLTEWMAKLPNPPYLPSSGSTIEDTEEDHEAALELCLGTRNSSPAHGCNNLPAPSGKPRIEASVALSMPVAVTGIKTTSTADHASRTRISSNTAIPAAIASLEPTMSSKSPVSSSKSPVFTKQVRFPHTTNIESKLLRGKKRFCSEALERCNDPVSKRFRTASTSSKSKCSTSASITIKYYDKYLKEQGEIVSAYISSNTNSALDAMTKSSDPGNMRASWWKSVMDVEVRDGGQRS